MGSFKKYVCPTLLWAGGANISITTIVISKMALTSTSYKVKIWRYKKCLLLHSVPKWRSSNPISPYPHFIIPRTSVIINTPILRHFSKNPSLHLNCDNHILKINFFFTHPSLLDPPTIRQGRVLVLSFQGVYWRFRINIFLYWSTKHLPYLF